MLLEPMVWDEFVIGDPEIEPLTEGECWTRAELGRLRAASWRPRALAHFLRAARARSNLTRRRRPELARQERIWLLAGAAGWLVPGHLPAAGPIAGARRRGLIWWAGCALMLDWHLGMLETPDGRAVGLGAADALTLTRAWLVPAAAQQAQPAVLLLAGLTDVADGRVARATRCTRFGRDLEGVVDAAFAAAALSGATRAGGLSALPVAVERARLMAGAVYATTVYFAAARAPDPAVRRSGRGAAPIRMVGLIAAGLGRHGLADRLLLAGSALAIVELVRSPDAGLAGSVTGRR